MLERKGERHSSEPHNLEPPLKTEYRDVHEDQINLLQNLQIKRQCSIFYTNAASRTSIQL